MASGGNIKNTELGRLLRGDEAMDEYEEAEFWTNLATSLSKLVPKTTPGANNGQEVVAEVEIPTPTTGSGGGGSGKFALTVAQKFKTGGLADFTGPAWLDGTKSKPEIVLNQRDSANFLVLRDILGEILNGPTGPQNSPSSGDNHFEIEINVEKLENDYDVEQLAGKIRSMLYEDAQYRNVNAVGFIR
jgi:hypothetical protein